MTYASERNLVRQLVRRLRQDTGQWGVESIRTEFDYQRGRTDVVAVLGDGAVVAFEAKLSRWREALHQAYRNTCFADQSFVVVPSSVATHAASYASEFERRGIGLCTVVGGRLEVLLEAPRTTPPMPWLGDVARELQD